MRHVEQGHSAHLARAGLAEIRLGHHGVFEIVEGIRSEATSVLLVEQNALQALARADRAYVMESGTTTLTGTGKELLGNPEVRLAYLGL